MVLEFGVEWLYRLFGFGRRAAPHRTTTESTCELGRQETGLIAPARAAAPRGARRPADLTQLIAFCGFFSMFFYATLYMQEVLHYSPLKAGLAYLPITAGFAIAGGLASQLVTRVGTRPIVVAGCLVAATGIYWVSRVPLHGSYVTDLLPGFVVMSLGAGSVFVSVTAAANAGVPADKAGLAAGLLNSSQQVGSALGLAILSAVAITPHRHSGRLGRVTRRGLGRRVPCRPPCRRHYDGCGGCDRLAHRQHPRSCSSGHGQRRGTRARAGVGTPMNRTLRPPRHYRAK